MASKKGFFGSRLFKNTMNMVYGLAAAVVIVGALFKIEHWEGASEMLIIGLGTEAFVFLVSAFDFPAEPYEWERVYPQLADSSLPPLSGGGKSGPNIEIPDNLDTTGLAVLGTTLKGLNDSVSKLSSVADAAGATNDYTSKIKAATSKISSLNDSYSVAVKSMGAFSNAATDAKSYHQQVQQITKNLKSLNSVYELELQDAKSHLKSLNQFYQNMTQAMSNMADAGKEVEAYKKGMSQLTKNIQKLNTIYGNMLSAMSGGR